MNCEIFLVFVFVVLCFRVVNVSEDIWFVLVEIEFIRCWVVLK